MRAISIPEVSAAVQEGMMRAMSIGVAVLLTLPGCGAPSVQEARVRTPSDGATETYGRPYADVYAATKQVIADASATPDWKELRLAVDEPERGVLVAERVLQGVIPGLRMRDVWSFYLVTRSPDMTEVTFVFESSDQPGAARGVRSWAKARSTIFPAIAAALGPSAHPAAARATEVRPSSDVMEDGGVTTAPPARPSSTSGGVAAPERRAAERPEPRAAAAPAEAAPPSPPAVESARPARPQSTAPLSIERIYAVLHTADDWRRTTARRRLAGEEVVTVGAWAQLSVRDGRVEAVFPSYPPPPAYDVARLIRFLDDAGFVVEVLPGTSFRTP